MDVPQLRLSPSTDCALQVKPMLADGVQLSNMATSLTVVDAKYLISADH